MKIVGIMLLLVVLLVACSNVENVVEKPVVNSGVDSVNNVPTITVDSEVSEVVLQEEVVDFGDMI